jgi:hypothetical protein
VFYWLVTETHHDPDPTVMPTEAEMEEAAVRGVSAWLKLTLG